VYRTSEFRIFFHGFDQDVDDGNGDGFLYSRNYCEKLRKVTEYQSYRGTCMEGDDIHDSEWISSKDESASSDDR
jgi:hypothetical protein